MRGRGSLVSLGFSLQLLELRVTMTMTHSKEVNQHQSVRQPGPPDMSDGAITPGTNLFKLLCLALVARCATGTLYWTVRSRMDRKQLLGLVLRRIQSTRKKVTRCCQTKEELTTGRGIPRFLNLGKSSTGKGMEKCGRLFIRKCFALISPTRNLSSTKCLPFTSFDLLVIVF